MPTVERENGIRIVVPDDYRVTSSPGHPELRAGNVRRGVAFNFRASPAEESGRDAENSALLSVLVQQEMTVVDAVDVAPPAAGTATPAALRRLPAAEAPRVEVDVRPGEDAVLLLEQEGLYSWSFASRERAAVPAPARRDFRASGATRTLVFDLDLGAAGEASAPAAGPARRDFLPEILIRPARAFILKFIGRIAVGQAVKFLERHVEKGLVVMDSLDATAWRRVRDLSEINLPADRPARILLFVHGTFSSTVGSYGALTATPWGQKLLEAARAGYDAVIGFDHPTLSEDPLENATDLLGRLERGSLAHTPEFDAVTYSRGALVLRSLVEELLPAARFQPRFYRVAFVGTTNGGTSLAEPDNWRTLVDLYTNLAVASTRALALLPQARATSLILAGLIQGLGALVKYLATKVVTQGGVPGLAAMEPKGAFVTRLNQVQPGEPTIASTFYCAVTSDFQPQIALDRQRAGEIPKRLLLKLASGLVDRLMKEGNDLVVNVSAMTAIDPVAGNYIKDRLDFGKNGDVYHTNYFTRPEVANALARWLALRSPEAAAAAPAAGTAADQVTRGAVVGAEPSATVDQDILLTDTETSPGDLLASIHQAIPSYVVLRRDLGGERFHYARTTEEVLHGLRTRRAARTVLEALGLHETTRSKVASVAAAGQVELSDEEQALVVLDGDQPVGVLPGSVVQADSTGLADLAGRILAPRGDEDRSAARRAMPTFTDPGGAAAAVPAGASGAVPIPSPANCNFSADMEKQVAVRKKASVHFTVSRETIAPAAEGRQSAAGAGKVDLNRKLVLQLIPKLNFKVIGEDRWEGDPPPPGAPIEGYFDVEGTNLGEGELLVVARQGQVPLVTLRLQALIGEQAGGGIRSAPTTARVAEVEEPPALVPELSIREVRQGPEVRYEYELDLRALGGPQGAFRKTFLSPPLRMAPEKYVDAIYEAIEQRWVQNSNDAKAFLNQLRAYGVELFAELFPPDLQTKLWEVRDTLRTIHVVSEEPFIPWELVHLTQPDGPVPEKEYFLAQMGLIRWLWLRDGRWAGTQLRVRPGRKFVVVPTYPRKEYNLQGAEDERKFLVDELGATLFPADSNSIVDDLLKKDGAFDLLHFACHGSTDKGGVRQSSLMLTGSIRNNDYVPDLFTPGLVRFGRLVDAADGKESRPFVAINACQSGQAGYRITGVGGFAAEFLDRGAGALLGTLWSVGDWPALAFVKTLYEQLRAGDGLAEATRKAREKARVEAPDATWLAYVVYGHPTTHVTFDA